MRTRNMDTFHAIIAFKIEHILRHFHQKNDSNYLRESVTVYSFVLFKLLPVCVKLYYSISGRWFILISPKNSGKSFAFQCFRKPWYATKRQHWPKMGSEQASLLTFFLRTPNFHTCYIYKTTLKLWTTASDFPPLKLIFNDKLYWDEKRSQKPKASVRRCSSIYVVFLKISKYLWENTCVEACF